MDGWKQTYILDIDSDMCVERGGDKTAPVDAGHVEGEEGGEVEPIQRVDQHRLPLQSRCERGRKSRLESCQRRCKRGVKLVGKKAMVRKKVCEARTDTQSRTRFSPGPPQGRDIAANTLYIYLLHIL